MDNVRIKLVSQKKYIWKERCLYELHVQIMVNGQVIGERSGSYKEVLDMQRNRELFGYDKIHDISKAELLEIKADLENQLRTIDTEEVFMYQGWNPESTYYLLSNYKVTADDVIKVNNQNAFREISLEKMPNINEIHSHITTGYFELLKHTEYSKIIMCMTVLSFFTTILHNKQHQPAFLTYVKAAFNRGKSSTVMALINPWNGRTYSFEDTEAVLKEAMKENRDVLLVIDDMSKSKRPGMTAKAERMFRMAGDTNTVAKKMVGGITDDSSVSCMSVITGETLPNLQDSSYTRMLLLDFDDDEINWDVMTYMQNNTELTIWFYLLFIQNSIKDDNFIDRLINEFLSYRAEYSIKFKQYIISNRYVDMCAWVLTMWDSICRFFGSNGIGMADATFKPALEKLIVRLGQRYSHKTPAYTFLNAFFALKEANAFNIVSEAEAKAEHEFDVIERENEYFIKSGTVYKKIQRYYDSQNIDFYDSERAIRDDLYKLGLIRRSSKTLTTEFKTRSNKSISGITLLRNNAKEFIDKKTGGYENV